MALTTGLHEQGENFIAFIVHSPARNSEAEFANAASPIDSKAQQDHDKATRLVSTCDRRLVNPQQGPPHRPTPKRLTVTLAVTLIVAVIEKPP